MLRTLTAVLFALATALTPIAAAAQSAPGGLQLVQAQSPLTGAQILKLRPGGGIELPGNLTSGESGPAESKVDCGASNAHYALCTKIKANCDKIHENAPNHGCGCTKDADGNLGTCETGV